MTNAQSAESYLGKNALDPEGNKIGSVGQVYLDDETGQPDWITVNTGLFGTNESFAPLSGSSVTQDGVVLPFGKDVIKGSPEIKDASHLDTDEQDALYSYYQQYLGGTASTQHNDTAERYDNDQHHTGDYQTSGQAAADTTEHDTDRAATSGKPAGDEYLTRSEEQLHVGTRRVEAGRAKLRKYVVTEQQSVTVPVTHDEVQVVREPLQPGESVDGATIGEGSIEVALMKDEVQVDKEVVGVERVKLATQTVTDQQEVTEQVRKEQIDVDGDTVAAVDPDNTGR